MLAEQAQQFYSDKSKGSKLAFEKPEQATRKSFQELERRKNLLREWDTTFSYADTGRQLRNIILNMLGADDRVSLRYPIVSAT